MQADLWDGSLQADLYRLFCVDYFMQADLCGLFYAG